MIKNLIAKAKFVDWIKQVHPNIYNDLMSGYARGTIEWEEDLNPEDP